MLRRNLPDSRRFASASTSTRAAPKERLQRCHTDAVSEVDDFLADVLPRLRAAEVALHDGDASGRSALWSHDDPVTLFGAERNRSGWSELAPTFDWLAGRFSECRSLEYEVVAAGAAGDLAYLATIERITAVAAVERFRTPSGRHWSSAGRREPGRSSIGTATRTGRTRFRHFPCGSEAFSVATTWS